MANSCSYKLCLLWPEKLICIPLYSKHTTFYKCFQTIGVEKIRLMGPKDREELGSIFLECDRSLNPKPLPHGYLFPWEV
jgi:hypothetical protein